MGQNRNYRYSDIDMLLASKTITKSLGDRLDDLSMVRVNWTNDYVTNLNNKIDNAIEHHLGLDKKMELRSATRLLAQIQKPALRDLSFIKTQIEVDFEENAAEINKNLGFSNKLIEVQKGNQEALILLLYTFKKNMTPSLKESLVKKGTNPLLIERIVSYADQLKDANVSQESLKETTKQATEEAVVLFNEIYKEIIGVCKIASNYYQHDPLVKELFSFSKVVANMSATKKIGTKGEEISH